jgi:hypothetical protein
VEADEEDHAARGLGFPKGNGCEKDKAVVDQGNNHEDDDGDEKEPAGPDLVAPLVRHPPLLLPSASLCCDLPLSTEGVPGSTARLPEFGHRQFENSDVIFEPEHLRKRARRWGRRRHGSTLGTVSPPVECGSILRARNAASVGAECRSVACIARGFARKDAWVRQVVLRNDETNGKREREGGENRPTDSYEMG